MSGVMPSLIDDLSPLLAVDVSDWDSEDALRAQEGIRDLLAMVEAAATPGRWQREPRWKRIVWPHSYDPATGLTTVRWFWHPIHVVTLAHRIKWRWWAWQQRNS